MEVDLYIEVPAGVRGRRAHSAWRAVYYCQEGQQAVAGGYLYLDGTPNAAALTALGAALSRLKYGCEVHVWTGNRYLGAALENGWVKAWSENGWVTNSGKEVANCSLWCMLELEMRRHRVTGKYVDDHKMKAEMRKEMKRRDEAAEEARGKHPPGG